MFLEKKTHAIHCRISLASTFQTRFHQKFTFKAKFAPDVMIPVEENQGLFMNDNKERVQKFTKK